MDNLTNEMIVEIYKTIEKKYLIEEPKCMNTSFIGKLEDIQKKQDWYARKIVIEAFNMYKLKLDEEDIKSMQKLYLLYPNNPPYILLSLSWEHIKVLIGIFSKKKRNFYIENCFKYGWDISILKAYILNDLYEKYCFLYNKVSKKTDILDRLLMFQNNVYD